MAARATDPNDFIHIFSTFMGMPPDTNTKPICGSTLRNDWTGRGKPHCPKCDKILQAKLAKH